MNRVCPVKGVNLVCPVKRVNVEAQDRLVRKVQLESKEKEGYKV